MARLDSNTLPMFVPDSDWVHPSSLPDLRQAKIIGFDSETHDPQLQDRGPGFIRGDAYVCGVSLAVPGGPRLYLPIAHAEGNMDRDVVIRYLRDMLETPDIVKCGANLNYDLEALRSLGVHVKGDLADIQVAEPLLDEDRPGGYSLNALAKTYLKVEKEEKLLNEAAAAYGVDPKGGMALLPAKFVAPYAEIDAELPLRIFELQQVRLRDEGLEEVWELERELQYVLFEMRQRGVRVDVDKAEKLSRQIALDEKQLHNELCVEAGRQFDPHITSEVAPVLHKRGINVPRTVLGNWSVTSPWLGTLTNDPFCAKIVQYRRTVKMRRDFIDAFIIGFHVNGRLHTQWHQLRNQKEGSDGDAEGGTKSGRIASSKPNLTQIPSRDPHWGPLIRSLFIADEGKTWVKGDYSQQEPRIMLHYGVALGAPGAAEAAQRYIDDPATDYHQLTAILIKDRVGKDIGRRHAKTINLGAAYGMGKLKLIAQLGIDEVQASEILEAYHEGLPYVRVLERACMDAAERRGYIRTLSGRKRRFELWEPVDRDENTKALRYTDAVKIYGDGAKLRRAYTRKALNSVVQGSAADQLKWALVKLAREGLPPQIQVYDELNGSYDVGDVPKLKSIMEQAISLRVPFLTEPEVGPSWGELKPWTP